MKNLHTKNYPPPILTTKNPPPKAHTECSLYNELSISIGINCITLYGITVNKMGQLPSAVVTGFLTMCLHWQERDFKAAFSFGVGPRAFSDNMGLQE